MPTTLDEALDALEADHAFLTKGDVFTDDLIGTYVEYRREQSDRVKIRPPPLRVPALLRRLKEAHGAIFGHVDKERAVRRV